MLTKQFSKHFFAALALILSGFASAFAQTAEIPQLAQPKLIALPRSLKQENPLELMKTNANINSAAAAIKQTLVERKLEVADLEGAVSNYDALRASMKNLEMDQNALLASAADADVYVEFTLELIKEGPTTKAKVILNVKESATAKTLGSSEGISPSLATNDISSLCALAVNNSIERVMEQIRGYWSEVPQRGKPIMLTINTANTKINAELPNGKFIDGEIEDFLKKNAKTFRNSMSTDNTLMFNPVYVDYVKYDSPGKFGRDLRSFFSKELGMKINLKNVGKSIRIEAE
jgi:hypothetical protein